MTVSDCFVYAEGGILMVVHLGLNCSLELELGGNNSWLPV